MLRRHVDLRRGWGKFHAVALNAERPTGEIHVIAAILQSQALEDFILANLLFDREAERHIAIGFGCANTINAADRRDDDDVTTLKQAARCAVPHAVDVLVDGAFFFNEGVGAWDVGLGLVIVVVTDEIFDRIVWEEFFHFAIQLGRQGFVVRKIRVGRCVVSITCAIVKVLPDPVTPNRTWF